MSSPKSTQGTKAKLPLPAEEPTNLFEPKAFCKSSLNSCVIKCAIGAEVVPFSSFAIKYSSNTFSISCFKISKSPFMFIIKIFVKILTVNI